MVASQTAQTRVDENDGKLIKVTSEAADVQIDGLIHAGQEVFLAGDQFIGLVTKRFLNSGGHVSHLVVQSARLFGSQKLVPITAINNVSSSRALLSIDRKQFMRLPDYHTDTFIAEEVDRALWKDVILRATDYHEIDVRVRDGIILLYGYVTNRISQWRVETAVKDIPGSLGVKSYLNSDDSLLLKVAQALIDLEQIEGSHVFAKMQNGAVILNGKVISADIRDLAEQYAANVPYVRGVINNITIQGIDLEPEDQRFLQPVIGESIFFGEGLSGIVKQVIINRNNRRVIGIILQGQFPERHSKFASEEVDKPQTADKLAIIPVSVIEYLTKTSGFLNIDSAETTKYHDFESTRFAIPDADWIPPYPYCVENVRFYDE